MKTLQIGDLPVRAGKFIARLNWIITASVSVRCDIPAFSQFSSNRTICSFVFLITIPGNAFMNFKHMMTSSDRLSFILLARVF